MLMLVKPLPKSGTEEKKEVELIPTDPVVAWGISLPKSSRPTERVEYVVNTQRYKELFGDEEEETSLGYSRVSFDLAFTMTTWAAAMVS